MTTNYLIQKYQKKLNQLGYLCDFNLATKVAVSIATKPVGGSILSGGAGTGKTFLTEIVSRIEKAQYFFYQCFPGTKEDDLLVKMLPSEKTQSGIALHDGVVSQAIKNCQDGKKTFLVLDEWDKTRPSADSFLLDFLQSGRINHNGHSAQLSKKELQNLTVFLTMNDEREVSEPLLRRLPKIDLEPLHPNLVRKALEKSHKNCGFIEAAVLLYERCLGAGIPKPATIQELRQLLDAIKILGSENADWDSLVYQFVTKTPENHYLLSHYGNQRPAIFVQKTEKIEVEHYQVIEELKEEVVVETTPKMPLPVIRRKTKSVVEIQIESDVEPDLTGATGIIELNDATYNAIVSKSSDLPENPNELVGWGRIAGKAIVLTNKLLLIEYKKIEALWGNEGEILFIEPLATWQNVKDLTITGLKIVEFSKKQILGYADGIDLRWTPENGAEIVVNLKNKADFEKVFSAKIENNYIDSKHFEWLKYNNGTTNKNYFGWCYAVRFEGEKIRRETRWRDGNKKVVIPDLCELVFHFEKLNQNKATSNNNVEVNLKCLFKPINRNNLSGTLFCQNIADTTWGNSQTDSEYPNYRQIQKTFEGVTYKEAFQKAQIYAHEELAKLIISQRKRVQALINAEKSLTV